MSVGKIINQQFLGYHMFGEGFIYVFFPVNSAGMWRFLDCCGLLRFAIDIWAISKTYSDLSIQCRTVTQVHPVLWVYGRHDGSMLSMAQYGSVMNVWIEDSGHIFGRMIGTGFWT